MTDTLRDIPREITEVLNENWVPSRVVYGTDEPDGFSSVRGWAAHVAEAILAIPGIAVVELPEPSEFADMWLHGDVWAASPSTHPGIPVALEIDPGSPVYFSVEYARDLAAALLAAADLAERDQ